MHHEKVSDTLFNYVSKNKSEHFIQEDSISEKETSISFTSATENPDFYLEKSITSL